MTALSPKATMKNVDNIIMSLPCYDYSNMKQSDLNDPKSSLRSLCFTLSTFFPHTHTHNEPCGDQTSARFHDHLQVLTLGKQLTKSFNSLRILAVGKKWIKRFC